LNYDEEKLGRTFMTAMTAAHGSRLHAFASEAIKLGQRLPESQLTLNQYVNDSIGFRMTPEVPLYYSDNCFGHADALGFTDMTLRIFYLKNGTAMTNEHQLEVYAALFCLEYNFQPFEISIVLRIYQNNEYREYIADPDLIMKIMRKIISFDKYLNELKEAALS